MTQALNSVEAIAPTGASPRDAGARVARVIALPELHPPQEGVDAKVDAVPVMRDWGALNHIKTQLQVSVGEATLTVGELVGAKPGHVVRLDSPVDQPVTLSIGGQLVARGQLVAVDGHFAVRLTELPAPLSFPVAD